MPRSRSSVTAAARPPGCLNMADPEISALAPAPAAPSIVAALIPLVGWWLLAALFCGYGFAWIGHFVFEKNKPVSFKQPIYSFIGDWVMYANTWTGKIRL